MYVCMYVLFLDFIYLNFKGREGRKKKKEPQNSVEAIFFFLVETNFKQKKKETGK